ncbi:MAG TPA: hypothetical protein VG943_05265 [Caulobacterales bacterium]|nr:hypothetical protein [Caulobacterales bacterium]
MLVFSAAMTGSAVMITGGLFPAQASDREASATRYVDLQSPEWNAANAVQDWDATQTQPPASAVYTPAPADQLPPQPMTVSEERAAPPLDPAPTYDGARYSDDEANASKDVNWDKLEQDIATLNDDQPSADDNQTSSNDVAYNADDAPESLQQ